MPKVQLPIFPAGSVEINRYLACRTEGEQLVYYNGHLPVFTHTKSDLASFRLFTSQLIVQGSATQRHVGRQRRAGEVRRVRAWQPAANRDGSRSGTERSADGPRPERVGNRRSQ